MGSGYFGIPSMGNGKTSSSSSRKNKKNSGSDKPKQPQRGLGVAQLEQIRLSIQMAREINNPPIIQEDIMRVPPYVVLQSSTSYHNYQQSSSSMASTTTYAHHPNFMVTFGDENLRYHDSQPSTRPEWNPNNIGVLDNSTYTPSRQLPFFQDPRHERMELMRSRSQNLQTSEHEDLDLELRLSI